MFIKIGWYIEAVVAGKLMTSELISFFKDFIDVKTPVNLSQMI